MNHLEVALAACAFRTGHALRLCNFRHRRLLRAPLPVVLWQLGAEPFAAMVRRPLVTLRSPDPCIMPFGKDLWWSEQPAGREVVLQAETLALAASGEALAQLALNRFACEHACFVRLHQLLQQLEQQEPAVIALHDAGVCLLKQRKGEEARQTFQRAIAALEQEEDSVDERLRLLSGLHICRWSSLAFEPAIDALSQMERLAREAHRREALCRALDQRGTCLQQLGKSADAIADHRAALAIARRLPDSTLAEHCLNNLGEALRRTNRTAAAIRAYRQAEAFSRAGGDRESAILTAHN